MGTTWQDEVLEGLCACGAGVNQQDARFHQRFLSAGAPQSQLPIVLVVCSHFFPSLSLALYPPGRMKYGRKFSELLQVRRVLTVHR